MDATGRGVAVHTKPAHGYQASTVCYRNEIGGSNRPLARLSGTRLHLFGEVVKSSLDKLLSLPNLLEDVGFGDPFRDCRGRAWIIRTIFIGCVVNFTCHAQSKVAILGVAVP